MYVLCWGPRAVAWYGYILVDVIGLGGGSNLDIMPPPSSTPQFRVPARTILTCRGFAIADFHRKSTPAEAWNSPPLIDSGGIPVGIVQGGFKGGFPPGLLSGGWDPFPPPSLDVVDKVMHS